MKQGLDRGRRIAAMAGSVILIAALTAPAHAAHGPDTPGGPYEGVASASAVHVDALTVGQNRAVNIDIGVANSAVDSEGLNKTLSEHDRRIVPGGITGKHSRGHATIAEVGALLSPRDADAQLAPFVAEVNAPVSGRESDSVLEQGVSPAVYTDLARRTAVANWNARTCVIGEPISLGEQHLARTQILETDADQSTDGFDAPLIGLDADQAGPPRASTHVISRQHLFLADTTIGLQSLVTETLAPVTFFDGTGNEFTIEFDGAAYLSATADGTPGGAKVIYEAPIVSVIQDGQSERVLPNQPTTIRAPASGDILALVQLGTVEALPSPKGLGGTRTTNGAGTRAAAQAHVVEITLADVEGQDFRGATVALGHMEAAATVPEGGIDCPIPVAKTADPEITSVGDTFDTTITIHNPFACPITNLALTDTITTENGATFEVRRAQPSASSLPSGSGLTRAVIEWPDLGTLQPGASRQVVLRLEAQGEAGRIIDEAVASGRIVNCPAQPGEAGADVTAMANVKVPVEGSARLAVAGTRVLAGTSTSGELPSTGVGIPLAAGAFMLSAAAGLTAWLRTPRRVDRR